MLFTKTKERAVWMIWAFYVIYILSPNFRTKNKSGLEWDGGAGSSETNHKSLSPYLYFHHSSGDILLSDPMAENGFNKVNKTSRIK